MTRVLPWVLMVSALFSAGSAVAAQETTPPEVELLDKDTTTEPEEENPWTSFLLAPMQLPGLWDSCLQGWAPWGKSETNKGIGSGCTMCLGAGVCGVSPMLILVSVAMLALAVVAAVFAVYAFVSSGFKGQGCMSHSGRSKASTCGSSLFDVWTWGMCLSYVVCMPWMGVKLFQRGWLAFRAPFEPAQKSPGGKKKGSPSVEDDVDDDEDAPGTLTVPQRHNPLDRGQAMPISARY